jgi:DNA mismatch repair ATPase MutL
LIIGKLDAGQILSDILGEIIVEEQSSNKTLRSEPSGSKTCISTFEKFQEKISKIIACRGAIKAGESLTVDQIKLLLNLLRKSKQPFTCPHGRPTVVKFSLQDINRLFGR